MTMCSIEKLTDVCDVSNAARPRRDNSEGKNASDSHNK